MKNTNPELCPICGGDKHPGSALFSAELGFGVLVVRDVPAMVCGQCGEEWFDAATSQRLEQIAEDARARHTNVEVVQFAA